MIDPYIIEIVKGADCQTTCLLAVELSLYGSKQQQQQQQQQQQSSQQNVETILLSYDLNKQSRNKQTTTTTTMEDEMYDDDVDLIEQVSDDEDEEEEEEAMETEQAAAQQQQQRPRGNRLTDQVNMDDEPTLQGYERYVTASSRSRESHCGDILILSKSLCLSFCSIP